MGGGGGKRKRAHGTCTRCRPRRLGTPARLPGAPHSGGRVPTAAAEGCCAHPPGVEQPVADACARACLQRALRRRRPPPPPPAPPRSAMAPSRPQLARYNNPRRRRPRHIYHMIQGLFLPSSLRSSFGFLSKGFSLARAAPRPRYLQAATSAAPQSSSGPTAAASCRRQPPPGRSACSPGLPACHLLPLPGRWLPWWRGLSARASAAHPVAATQPPMIAHSRPPPRPRLGRPTC